MIRLNFDCPENVEDMPKTDCGFFCDSCKREVYDFRGKTLVDIKKIREDNPKIMCGVFDNEVLETDHRSTVNTIFRLAFAAVFVLGFNASILFGQTEIHYPDSTKTTEVSNEMPTIKGVITDEKGKPIKDATINYYIGGDRFYLKTDANGAYSMELSSELLGQYFYFDVTSEGMNAEYRDIAVVEGIVYQIDIELTEYKEHRIRTRRGRTAGVMAF